jgi:hypothetical protein
MWCSSARGDGRKYPTISVVADSVVYNDTLAGRWRFKNSSAHIMGTPPGAGDLPVRQRRRRR